MKVSKFVSVAVLFKAVISSKKNMIAELIAQSVSGGIIETNGSPESGQIRAA